MAKNTRSPCQYFSVKGEVFRPTLKASPNFNAAADAETLCRSMRCWGTDEQKIIDILGGRTCEERLKIADEYKRRYSRELAQDLDGELSGHFKDCALLLTESPFYLMAKSLYYAMKGIGTNEGTLIEVLVGCSNEEIKRLNEAYIHVLRDKGIKDPKRTLESDIRCETSGPFNKMLLEILKAEVPDPTEEQLRTVQQKGSSIMVNEEAVSRAVKQLKDALRGPKDSGHSLLLEAFQHKNPYEIAAMAEEYLAANNKTLTEAIAEAVSGEFGELLKARVVHATNRPGFYSEALYHSMVGAGTRDFLLMRVIILRSEIDLLDIKEAFDKNHKSLVAWIKGDTSGDYEKLLLKLMNEC